MAFRCAALLLSLAFAGAPVAADFCAASCDAAHIADSAGSSGHAGHHHHHGPTAASNIGQGSQPCGHDHNGIVAVRASSDAAHGRPATTANVAVLPVALPAASLATSVTDLCTSNSPPGPSVRGFVSPIRI
jgi:hypothetical protein